MIFSIFFLTTLMVLVMGNETHVTEAALKSFVLWWVGRFLVDTLDKKKY